MPKPFPKLSVIILPVFLVVLFFVFSSIADAATLIKAPTNLGLVGYWSMNEGVGSIAHDFSGNGNNGTMVANPTWVPGKLGQALSFNGSSQYVKNTHNTMTSVGTVAFWMKPSTLDTSSQTDGYSFMITRAGATNATRIYIKQNNNHLDLTIGSTSFSSVYTFGSANQWYHIVITWNGANGNYIAYVNGNHVATSSYTGWATNDSCPTEIALYYSSTNCPGGVEDQKDYFSGSLDDVRIYNRALSAGEVTALYNSGLVKLNTSQNGFMTNGLIGLWSFDGKDLGTTTAYDRSGQGNNGTLVASPTRVAGKLGQALSFNGTSQYVNLPTSSTFIPSASSPLTASVWFQATSIGAGGYANRMINIQKGSGSTGFMMFLQGSNQLGFYASTTAHNASITPSLNKWYHFVVTYNGTSFQMYVNGVANGSPITDILPAGYNNASDHATIGQGIGGSYFKGSLDDVRIYNRALSAGEVMQLYQHGTVTHETTDIGKGSDSLTNGLVGYWSFNGKDLGTTTAYDRSGQGNNGTLVASPTRVAGKLGQALSFNGTSQYVNVSTLSSTAKTYTFSFWVKSTQSISISTGSYLFDSQTGRLVIGFISNDLTTNQIGYYDGTWHDLTGTPNDGKWHNVVFVLNSGASTGSYYKDGVFVVSSSYTGINIGGSSAFGARYDGSASKFNGFLDDVRIYNRALSAGEVMQLYNLGK